MKTKIERAFELANLVKENEEMLSRLSKGILKTQALKKLEESTTTTAKPNANKGGWLGGKMNGTGQYADSWTYGVEGPDGKFHKTVKPQYI